MYDSGNSNRSFCDSPERGGEAVDREREMGRRFRRSGMGAEIADCLFDV